MTPSEANAHVVGRCRSECERDGSSMLRILLTSLVAMIWPSKAL